MRPVPHLEQIIVKDGTRRLIVRTNLPSILTLPMENLRPGENITLVSLLNPCRKLSGISSNVKFVAFDLAVVMRITGP
jgi:hypothetical protein